MFFEEAILERCINLLLLDSLANVVLFNMAFLLVDIAALMVMLMYFSGNRLSSPKPVYAVLLLDIDTLLVLFHDIAIGATGHMAKESMGYYTYSLLGHLLRAFLSVSLLLLLAYMAHELDVKRKVSMTAEGVSKP